MKPENISLRNWYAGMAMQALLSQPNIGFILKKTNPAMSPEEADQAICATSFRIADKMIEERIKNVKGRK